MEIYVDQNKNKSYTQFKLIKKIKNYQKIKTSQGHFLGSKVLKLQEVGFLEFFSFLTNYFDKINIAF